MSHIFTLPSGIKDITDFRNIEEGSTFWIIGSDPNLDCYPDNFFDNKSSIAINSSCIAFPSSSFFLLTSNPIAEGIKHVRPEFLSKCIMPLNYTRPLKQLPYWDQLDPHWEDYGLDPIYLISMITPQSTQTKADWARMVGQICGDGPIEFVWPTSTAYFGIEAAAVFGAKRIILVGMSHKTTKYLFHAQKRGMWFFAIEEHLDGKKTYPDSWTEGYMPTLLPMVRDTIWLTKEFAKYGVEIIRHRFDEEKEDFVFEEIKGT